MSNQDIHQIEHNIQTTRTKLTSAETEGTKLDQEHRDLERQEAAAKAALEKATHDYQTAVAAVAKQSGDISRNATEKANLSSQLKKLNDDKAALLAEQNKK